MDLDETDEAFIAAFERAEIPNGEFRHRSHLRMAWIYVRRLGADGAAERAGEFIRKFATLHGSPGKYHETLTRAWIYLVAAAERTRPVSNFDLFVDANPVLLDKQLIRRHYSAAVLASQDARQGWVPPDLEPIPGAPVVGVSQT